MAQIRIRLTVDQGRRGVRLASLGQLATDVEKFLEMLGRDTGVDALAGDWIATDFANGSLSFSVESGGEADEEQATVYRRAIANVTAYDPSVSEGISGIRNETLVQYARVAQATEIGDTLKLAVYENGSDAAPTWLPLSHRQATGIIEQFHDSLEYSGSLHGIIHSLYKEAQPAYFDIRDLSTGYLVKCHFTAELYPQVWTMLKKKDAVVMVQGEIRARRGDHRIEHIQVERMSEAPTMSDDQFERFFGCAPTLTGKRTTSDFLNRVRRGR